ncbi:MAG: MinD/ParA family protein [Clostridium butyricum]|nr:MinD/ParA family protein [Clostridium butyricum]
MLDQAESLRKLVSNKNNELSKKQTSSMKIITVTSGKGGVGKSNFVVNLAVTLQKKGKKVLIFDADLGMGNDDVLLGLYPKYNIFDIIFTTKKIEDIIIEGPCGISLIPGGSGLNKVQELDEKEKQLFLKELDSIEEYDYLLMDTGAGVSKDILSFISASEELIVITTPEPTSLTDAYSLIKATDHFKLQTKAKIVVNRAFTKEEGQETFNKMLRAVSRFLEIDIDYLGCILDDRKLVQSVRAQKPFVLLYPNCDATKNIEEIAKKIIGECESSSEGVKGLFKKIFNVFS